MVWPGYRKVRRQVYKRLARRLQSLGLASLADYQAYLETHPDEWKTVDAACWISISRFYRDKGVFQYLEHEVLPELARRALVQGDRTLRCWSIGCASGEEPYTLVLMWTLGLQERGPDLRLTVLATDVDSDALGRAQRACYSPSSLKDLPDAWLVRGFVRTNGEFCLKPEFHEPVTFSRQDVRAALPDERFHLILCRYLAFTYFDEVLQRETAIRIAARLVEGGALILGSQEHLPAHDLPFEPWAEQHRIYRYRAKNLDTTCGRANQG